MLLKDYLDLAPIKKKEFAKMININGMYLYHILARRRRVGADLAKRIERETNGIVSRLEALYPEDFEEKTKNGNQFRFPQCPCRESNI